MLFYIVFAALSFCFYVLDYLIDIFEIGNLSIFYTPPLEFHFFNCILIIVILSFVHFLKFFHFLFFRGCSFKVFTYLENVCKAFHCEEIHGV